MKHSYLRSVAFFAALSALDACSAPPPEEARESQAATTKARSELTTQATSAGGIGCFVGLKDPRRVLVSWNELKSALGRVSTSGTLSATILNTGSVPVVGFVQVKADAGASETISKKLTDISLRPGEQAVVTVDLKALGLDIERMQTAGAMHLMAVFPPIAGTDSIRALKVASPDLFFHPLIGDRIEVYDPETLKAELPGGDFRGGAKSVRERDSTSRRILDVGARENVGSRKGL